MLSVTNGSSPLVTMRAASIPGDFLAWDDVLHEGPVPATGSREELRVVRARYLATPGWATFDQALDQLTRRDRRLNLALADGEEIVLWFEHDLYDQLQLLQILDRAAADPAPAPLRLLCGAEYVGSSTPARLAERFPARVPVTAAQLDLASRAWAAFRRETPADLVRLLDGDTSPLPFLGAALRRHLQQFPGTATGLSRSEAQALLAIRRGADTPMAAFRASHHAVEDPVFLGDSVFATYLAGLSDCPTPLLLADGEVVRLRQDDEPGFWNRRLALTAAGEAVLDQREDHVRLNGIDRWLGGVHLHGNLVWRWDEEGGRVVGSEQ